MIKEILRTLLAVGLVFSSLACAAKRPVLYPNAKLASVGLAAAQQDVDDCLRRATEGGLESKPAGKVAKSTAVGAAAGAAVGAAAGAVVGSAGSGAAMGAAGGGTGGLIRGLFSPWGQDSERRRAVEECLRVKGYEVTGWQ